jgi:hypothetical protein
LVKNSSSYPFSLQPIKIFLLEVVKQETSLSDMRIDVQHVTVLSTAPTYLSMPHQLTARWPPAERSTNVDRPLLFTVVLAHGYNPSYEGEAALRIKILSFAAD